MSGPKGYAYSVVSAAELARRAAEQSRARCSSLRVRLEKSRAEARALGWSVSVPSERDCGTDTAGWAAYEQELAGALAKAEQETRTALADTWSRQIRTALGAIEVEIDLAAPDQVAPRQRTGESPEVTRLRASVLAATELMASLDDQATRDALAAEAMQTLAALDAGTLQRATGLLSGLQSHTTAAVRQHRQHARVRERAEELTLELADLPGPDAQALTIRIDQAADHSALEAVAAEIDALRARRAAEQDRIFVAAQTEAALRGLGYQLDDSFVVQALDGGPQIVAPPGLPGHGLQVQFLPGSNRLLTNVVAFGETTGAADLAAEEATCGHLAKVQEAWAAGGVTSDRYHARLPGQVQMERMPAATGDERLKKARKRRTERTQGAS